MYRAVTWPSLFLAAIVGSAHAIAAQYCNPHIRESSPTSSWVLHSNGTAVDRQTGLMWKRCREGQSLDSAGSCTGIVAQVTWQQALQTARTSQFAGYSDWRLPNIKELRSIIEDRCNSPALNITVFPITGYFNVVWSSTPDIRISTPDIDAWMIQIIYGDTAEGFKTGVGGEVLLVRAGSSFASYDTIPEQTPPSRPNFPEDSSIAPAHGTKAVVITHGYSADASGWVKEMAQLACLRVGLPVSQILTSVPEAETLTKICQRVDSHGTLWDVWVLDWQGNGGAHTPFGALGPARSRGEALGASLRAKIYSHVHLIAHSAGGKLIDAATTWLKAMGPSPSVQASFLDAFDPYGFPPPPGFPYFGRRLSRYGIDADWADNYVDIRVVGLPFTNIDGTDLHLEYGFNFNVTPNYDGCALAAWTPIVCRHSRPWRVYGRSVDSAFFGDFESMQLDPIDQDQAAGVGFNLSLENDVSLGAMQVTYPDGGECVLGAPCVPAAVQPSFWGFIVSSATTLYEGASGSVTYLAATGGRLFDSLRLGAGELGSDSNVGASAGGGLDIPTEAPSWITFQVTTAQAANTLRFGWRFASVGQAYLRIYVDGILVREIDQRNVSVASTSFEEVFIGGSTGILVPGVHRLVFRLDGFGTNPSAIELTNVAMGMVTATPATTAGLTALPNPSVVGQLVTFVATITGLAPTGSVSFVDGPQALPGCSAVPLSGNGNARTATCIANSLLLGSHPISATYSGDGVNQVVTAVLTQTVVQPCGAFVDIGANSVFCPNVEWLKNRAITLGCTSATAYCPDSPVGRLAMAAFMNRLGASLTGTTLWQETSLGALDLDVSPVVCQTADFVVAGFPRRAILDSVLSGTSANEVGFASSLVASFDGGATWAPVGAASKRTAAPAGQWGTVRNGDNLDLDVGQTARFGLRVSRDGLPGTTDLSDSRCALRALVGNRNRTSSPYELQ